MLAREGRLCRLWNYNCVQERAAEVRVYQALSAETSTVIDPTAASDLLVSQGVADDQVLSQAQLN